MWAQGLGLNKSRRQQLCMLRINLENPYWRPAKSLLLPALNRMLFLTAASASHPRSVPLGSLCSYIKFYLNPVMPILYIPALLLPH